MKKVKTKDHTVYTGKSLVYEDFCVAVHGQLTKSQKTALFQVVATLVSAFEKPSSQS